MKAFLITVVSLSFFAASCGQKNDNTSTVSTLKDSSDESVVTCVSMDPTFSPHYRVKVNIFDETHPGSYVINIDETDSDGYPGPVTVVHHREAHGRELDEDGAGVLTFEDGELSIEKLDNGFLKGEMTLGDDSDIELACELPIMIQPVGGVGN